MKDLTNIVEYSKKLEQSGEAPAPTQENAGVTVDEPAIEKIDNFESLEEYSKSNKLAEPPAEAESLTNAAVPGLEGDIPGLSMEGAPAAAASGGELSNAVTGIHADTPLEMDDLANASLAPVAEAPESLADLDSTQGNSFEPAPEPPVSEPMEAGKTSTKTLTKSAKTSAEKIAQYSERMMVGRPVVQAAFPFSLLITGPLTTSEREKILDLISRENMGIREVDLEPQFEAGRLLIPRISEYAGVLLVQALRGTRAKMRLGPSDSIFATDDTRDTEDDQISASVTSSEFHSEQAEVMVTSDLVSPAESIPVTPLPTLPDHAGFSVVDAVTASATIKTSVVEAESSVEYQEVLEALQRELKYKAFRRGANAIVNFSVTLTPLTLASHYRLSVMGSAVKAAK